MTGFDAYDNAVAISVAMREVVRVIKTHDPDLADQTKRATQSIGLNVAEARKRTGRDRLHQFKVALGSACEARSAMHQAEAWGYLEAERAKTVLELLDREIAMLWRLGGH